MLALKCGLFCVYHLLTPLVIRFLLRIGITSPVFFVSHSFYSVNLNNLDVFVYVHNRTSSLRLDVLLSQLSHLLPNNQIIIGPANVTAAIPNNTQPSDLDSLFISVSIICFSVNKSSRCSLLPVRMNLVLDSSRIFSSLIILLSSLI